MCAAGRRQQGEPGFRVEFLLDAGDLGRDPVLRPLEVDDAVLLLVAATDVAGREPAVDVAAAGVGLGPHQRLLRLVGRDLGEVGDGLEPAPRTGWLALAQRHWRQLPKMSMRSSAATFTTARFVAGR